MPKNLFLTLFILPFAFIKAQTVSITFEVDMSYQIELGAFNPQSEFVDIAGTFNSWGSTLNALSDHDNDQIWSVTIHNFSAGENIEFKFRYNGVWDDREEFPGAGNNRVHTVADTDETLTFWYNDDEPPTGPAIAGISASSTFSFTGGSIIFSEDADGLVENYVWTFEGGSPSSSNNSSVEVTYDQPGTYDVSLMVSNSFSEDELVLEDYITIEDQSTDDLDWWNQSVFYEIFVRSFYDSDGDGVGDFKGLTEKLDYLNDGDPNTSSDLGITGIWLMPINNSPSYHGYDVTDYRSINPDYGTMDDFKEFLSEAHARGIKVIIDLVINHTSTQIDWFQDAVSSPNSDKRNWYRWSDSNPNYSGPWGQTVWHNSSTGYYYGLFWGGMPDLNYDEPEVVDEVFDITKFWLEDVGIDGFRLDAVKYIKEEDDKLEDLASTHEFWREWVAVTKESNEDALSVGEAWTSTEKVVPYVVNDGMDFCFEFDLGSSILNAIKSENTSNLKVQINKVINSYPYYQFGTFLTNHDMNRVMNEFSSDEEKVKLAATIYLTMPGIPFIYYGEEVGMTGQKPDEDIRRPMSWSDEANAGFSSTSPWNFPSSNYQTNNVETQKKDGNSLFTRYRKLIGLRNGSEALKVGEYRSIDTGNEGVIGYERFTDSEEVIVLVNVSSSAQEIDLDVSGITRVGTEPALVNQLDGSARYDILNTSEITVSLEAYEAAVFMVGDLTLSTARELSDFTLAPNPSSNYFKIKSEGLVSYRIYDLNGMLLKSGEGYHTQNVEVSSMPQGVFLIEIQTESQVSVKKLIISR